MCAKAEKANLGAAKAPAGVDSGTVCRIEEAIDDSFVTGVRMAMVASAVLALTGALVAALFVGSEKSPTLAAEQHRLPESGFSPC